MEVEKKKFVDKELEGFEKVDDIAPNKSIRQEFKSDNYELFFFQFPKSFDISKLDGQKLQLGQDVQVLEGVDAGEKEEIVLEKLGEEHSNLRKICNYRKKFSKVFKLYSRFDPGRIRKRFIIKTKPRISTKLLEEAQAKGAADEDEE